MISQAQKTLLALLAQALYGAPFSAEGADWRAVMEESAAQSVILIAQKASGTADVPEDVRAEWAARANEMLLRNLRVFHNHALLHGWMTDAGIPYVILKGCASAAYYPVPEYRQMGDVDFLVREQDVARAGEALTAQGLPLRMKQHESHVVYRGDGMHYELHFALPGMPVGAAGERMRALTEDVLSDAKETENGRLPSPLHHGLVLLMHTCHHLTGEGIGLRHLCDWSVFVSSMTDEAFCAMFEAPLRETGLWQFACTLTACCRKYLGCPAGAWAQADAALTDALMEDILESGNFGKKDTQRINQAYLISARGKSGVTEGSLLRQFADSMNRVVYTKWNAAKTCKLLLPFGWLWFGAVRAVQIAQGRKPALKKEDLSGATERRALYSKLSLYQPEKRAKP